jgi:hypothetical protein
MNANSVIELDATFATNNAKKREWSSCEVVSRTGLISVIAWVVYRVIEGEGRVLEIASAKRGSDQVHTIASPMRMRFSRPRSRPHRVRPVRRVRVAGAAAC